MQAILQLFKDIDQQVLKLQVCMDTAVLLFELCLGVGTNVLSDQKEVLNYDSHRVL